MMSILRLGGLLAVAIAGLVILLGNATPQAIDVTESVTIYASRRDIWAMASDFEGAFERSNPDHDGLTILSDPKTPFRDGLRFLQQEYVGGLRGVLDGVVFDVVPKHRFRWRAETDYAFRGISIVTIREGGDFRIERTGAEGGFRVSHRVWGDFPDTIYGRTLSWIAASLLDMETEAARHTLVELEYFKEALGPAP